MELGSDYQTDTSSKSEDEIKELNNFIVELDENVNEIENVKLKATVIEMEDVKTIDSGYNALNMMVMNDQLEVKMVMWQKNIERFWKQI